MIELYLVLFFEFNCLVYGVFAIIGCDHIVNCRKWCLHVFSYALQDFVNTGEVLFLGGKYYVLFDFEDYLFEIVEDEVSPILRVKVQVNVHDSFPFYVHFKNLVQESFE